MKYFQFWTPILSILFSVLLCKAEHHPNEDDSCVPQSISTSATPRCGEILTASSGTIIYKPYHKIAKNERCVWTLGADPRNRYRYEIDILYLGFPNSNETSSSQPSLMFSDLPIQDWDLFTISTPASTGLFNFSATTLLITFSSGELEENENYTGFILQFKRAESSTGSPSSHKIVMPRIKVNFTATESTGVGTLVFPPENNTYPGTSYPLVYLEYGSSMCQFDSKLRIYHFDRSNSTFPWQLVDRLLCTQETAIISGHDDLWMITVIAKK